MTYVLNRIAVMFSILFLLSSCSPRIIEEISYRDTTIYRDRIIHDSVAYEVPRIMEKIVTRDTTSHIENDFAESDAVISGGLLHHSLMTRPHTIYVPYTVEVHDTTRIVSDAKTITKIKEVNRLTKWQSFSIILGRFAMIILFLLLVVSLIKKGQ